MIWSFEALYSQILHEISALALKLIVAEWLGPSKPYPQI